MKPYDIYTTDSVTFEAGVTSQTIYIPIITDSHLEDYESVNIDLTDEDNLILNSSQGYGGITDDDMVSVNLDTDSNNNGKIEINDDPIEEQAPGKVIAANGSRAKIAIGLGDISYLNSPSSWQLKLVSTSGSNLIEIYDDEEHGNELIIDANGMIETWTLADSIPDQLWIQGIDQGDVELELKLLDVNSNVQADDKIRLESLESVVVNSTDDEPDSDPFDGVCGTGELNAVGDPECTLRAAIQYVNAKPGRQAIIFDIPVEDTRFDGTGYTIPESNLPEITSEVYLDATTQREYDFNSTPVVMIKGLDASITLKGGNSTIRGLSIIDTLGTAISIESAGDNVIELSYIGVELDGYSVGMSHNVTGVFVDNVANNIIRNNVFEGNTGDQIHISGSGATGTHVLGNLIGTYADGSTSSVWTEGGVLIDGGASHNIVGTDGDEIGDSDERNVISGNSLYGIKIDGDSTNENIVAGNHIGINEVGNAGISMQAVGILVSGGAQENRIGTDSNGSGDVAERNIISGNSTGVKISGSNTDENFVAGNYIGLNSDGDAGITTFATGVLIESGAQKNRIGTNGDGERDAAERNVISGNSRGVIISGDETDQNILAGNYIGTDPDGTIDLGNTSDGVKIENGAGNNRIGTDGDSNEHNANEGNVISGNGGDGIYITDSDHNVIAGNLIGTDITGEIAMGNDATGIKISSGSGNNRVGTDGEGDDNEVERNVVSGSGLVGIRIEGSDSDDNIVAGNFIGTDKDGETAIGNEFAGVSIENGSKKNRIGTNGNGSGDYSERNVISGNDGYGVHISDIGTDENVIAGNFIGVKDFGFEALANDKDGVHIADGASQNRVGTDGSGSFDETELNVISGNRSAGVFVTGYGTDSNIIAGNAIGVDVETSFAIANSGSNGTTNGIFGGVVIAQGASYNRIGTDGDGQEDTLEGNTISGNLGSGVQIQLGSDHNVVAGNEIGAGFSSTAEIPNFGHGVEVAGAHNRVGTGANSGDFTGTDEANIIAANKKSGIYMTGSNNIISGNDIGKASFTDLEAGNEEYGILIAGGASDNQIGSNANDNLDENEGNLIAKNGKAGVYVKDNLSDGNRISRNWIYENGGLGIDLESEGASVNDSGDTDNGPNQQQNAPLIWSVTKDLALTTLLGELRSKPETDYRIEFFENGISDNWFTESKSFIESIVVTTDDNGYAKIERIFANRSEHISATATDPDGNTSEFGLFLSIDYLPTGEGTTGELIHDNPDSSGSWITVDFEGGYRFFPGAENYGIKHISRNIVRIRAAVPDILAGQEVFFRSFDVDDPDDRPAVDPNSNDGRDNRGTLTGNLLNAPGDSIEPNGNGYQGRLRRAGLISFEAEGQTVSAVVDSNGFAEVELATTFAPGDNFRVAASFDEAALQALNDTTGMPIKSVPSEFNGVVTEQLSVWRKLHVERDSMDAPVGVTFGGVGSADDDVNPGNIGNPSINMMISGYRAAYIEVVDDLADYDLNDELPFVRNLGDPENNPLAPVDYGRGRRDVWSSDLFWATQIFAAYEYRQTQDNDSDIPDMGSATQGITRSEAEGPPANIFVETIRDTTAAAPIPGISYNDVLERTVYHESLHNFTFLHSYIPDPDDPNNPPIQDLSDPGNQNVLDYAKVHFKPDGDLVLSPAQIAIMRKIDRPDKANEGGALEHVHPSPFVPHEDEESHQTIAFSDNSSSLRAFATLGRSSDYLDERQEQLSINSPVDFTDSQTLASWHGESHFDIRYHLDMKRNILVLDFGKKNHLSDDREDNAIDHILDRMNLEDQVGLLK